MKKNTIAVTKYVKGYTIEFITGFNIAFKKVGIDNVPDNDIQILIKDKTGTTLLSAISKYGSYGVEDGLWETMCSIDGDVVGHLTFSEVIHKINKVCKLDIKRRIKV